MKDFVEARSPQWNGQKSASWLSFFNPNTQTLTIVSNENKNDPLDYPFNDSNSFRWTNETIAVICVCVCATKLTLYLSLPHFLLWFILLNE